jgi:hypothetical protein
MTSKRAYWNHITENLEINILAKDLHPAWDPDSRTYTSHSKINEEALTILKDNTSMELVLDFGTGLGRNHEYLKSLFKKVNGYDIPSMISRGAELEIDIDLYSSDWEVLSKEKYDLVYECVCFQHVDIEELRSKLTDIASISKYLYINSRSYNDTNRNFSSATGGYNIAKTIIDLNLFSVEYADIDLDTAITLLDETHYQILFKSNNY